MIRWLERRKRFSWIITFLLAFFIFYMSSRSFHYLQIGREMSLLQILYHITVFFLFSIFLFISLINGKKTRFLFFIAILFLLSYGILDEIHQFFVPGRFCSVFDFGLDFLGILFGFMLYTISLEYRKL